MTDKETIICKYKFQNKEKFNGKPYCTCFNELCEDLSFACDHNCQIYEDYKQLVSKTQELELAEQLINGILKTLNLEAYDYRADQNEILTEIRAFKQECEQKDKEIKGLHLIIDRLLEASGYDKHISSAEDFEDVYKDMDYKLGLIDELKQECKELKAYARRQENQREEYYKEYLKKDKALEEIEEVLKDEICEECPGERGCKGGCKERQCLNIINKAKGRY